MKIVSWNCNGALRKKVKQLEQLDADIYIVQECEDPKRSTIKFSDWAGNYLWNGDSKNKGIGVFAKKNNKIRKLNWDDSFSLNDLNTKSPATKWKTADLKLFLPFNLNGKYSVLAAWTKGSRDHTFGYIGQLWKYLKIHRKDLDNNHSMIIGDLNSNSIWDRKDRWWNHTDVVQELSELGLVSLYHKKNGEIQGSESQPTFYLHRKKEKAYHIDYIFMNNEKVNNAKLKIGNPSKWLEFSDHMPLIIELDE
ncbi:endonuclease/exonuclease/phosphatase family protein [Gracilimonas sp. BCB1]|uniref:endonuclease/exonuclease/phosphatase family protein n=1 Tax=Gracilimonas sp. BCB1 TaxID=3152362 RepID=UPI0032D9A502